MLVTSLPLELCGWPLILFRNMHKRRHDVKTASTLTQMPSRKTGVVLTGRHLNDISLTWYRNPRHPYPIRTRAIQSGYVNKLFDAGRARAEHHTLIISRDYSYIRENKRGLQLNDKSKNGKYPIFVLSVRSL